MYVTYIWHINSPDIDNKANWGFPGVGIKIILDDSGVNFERKEIQKKKPDYHSLKFIPYKKITVISIKHDWATGRYSKTGTSFTVVYIEGIELYFSDRNKATALYEDLKIHLSKL